MAERTRIRSRALVLFITPVALLAAFIVHPYLVNELDAEAAAAAVIADPTRWIWAHIMLMAGFAMILLAVGALRHLLRTAGEDRWSFIAAPLIVVGSVVFIAVWGFEITIAAVANVGGDVEEVLKEGDRWFAPLGIAGYLMYFLGWAIMALAVRRSQLLRRRLTWVVLGATVVILAGLSFPSTAGAYLFTFGLMGFTWTMGYHVLSSTRGHSDPSSGAADN